MDHPPPGVVGCATLVPMTVLDWSKAVVVESGGYMRLEDFCNSTPRGASLVYTSGIVLADEELLGIENGWRVANYVMEGAVDGWDALLDLHARVLR